MTSNSCSGSQALSFSLSSVYMYCDPSIRLGNCLRQCCMFEISDGGIRVTLELDILATWVKSMAFAYGIGAEALVLVDERLISQELSSSVLICRGMPRLCVNIAEADVIGCRASRIQESCRHKICIQRPKLG